MSFCVTTKYSLSFERPIMNISNCSITQRRDTVKIEKLLDQLLNSGFKAVADPGFPVGGVDLVGGALTPKAVTF